MGRETVGNQSLLNGRSGWFRIAAEDAPDVDEVIGDHAESDPALHAAFTMIPAAVKAVAPLHHTDASLAAGPPFLPGAEPALVLFQLAFGAPGVAIGNADSLDSLFVARRVEGRVCGD